MKTFKDLKCEHINKIYSIILGREVTAGKIDWTEKNDFVVAVFKKEECVTTSNYDFVEYGITINDNLEVHHTWWWINNTTKHSTAVDDQPLYHHHQITKYLMDQGFDVFGVEKEIEQ